MIGVEFGADRATREPDSTLPDRLIERLCRRQACSCCHAAAATRSSASSRRST